MTKHCPECGGFMSRVPEGWYCKEHGYLPTTADKKAILVAVNDHIHRMRELIVPAFVIPQIEGTDEELVVVLSDWHVGRRNFKEGKEIWNSKLAGQAIESVLSNVHELMNKYLGTAHSFDAIHVMILGDIIDDEKVFPEQAFKLDKTVIFQFKKATRMLVSALKELAIYDIPIIVHTKSGNHKDKYTPRTSSWDNAVYIASEIATVDIENIHWDINLDARHVVEIKGHRFLLMHGNDAPAQTQTAYARGKFGGWFERYRFDAVITGHYHHGKVDDWNQKPIVYNGTIMCGDDLAERMSFNDSLPSQTVFGVSKKRVMTFWFKADTKNGGRK